METTLVAYVNVVGDGLRMFQRWGEAGASILTKWRNAVYDHKTDFVATRSPLCLRSIANAALKKSFRSSESALFATHAGPDSATQLWISLGTYASAMLCIRVEKSRAMSC